VDKVKSKARNASYPEKQRGVKSRGPDARDIGTSYPQRLEVKKEVVFN
jgi:hypothetical protein